MDEDFEFFLKRFGEGFSRRRVSQTSLNKYRDRLPEQLLRYWEAYGWCGYAKGLFWTVDPEDYEAVVAASLEGTEFENSDTYHVIAKGAFGELHLWGEKTANCLRLCPCLNRYIYNPDALRRHNDARAIGAFFAFQGFEVNNFDGMFSEARKNLGALQYDEIYGFVPALAFGGEPSLKRLKKVKDVEHMLLLAQLEPMQHWELSGWDLTET